MRTTRPVLGLPCAPVPSVRAACSCGSPGRAGANVGLKCVPPPCRRAASAASSAPPRSRRRRRRPPRRRRRCAAHPRRLRRNTARAASDTPLAGVSTTGTRPLTIVPSTAMPSTMPMLRAELARPAATPAWSRGMLATATVFTGALRTRVAQADEQIRREQPADGRVLGQQRERPDARAEHEHAAHEHAARPPACPPSSPTPARRSVRAAPRAGSGSRRRAPRAAHVLQEERVEVDEAAVGEEVPAQRKMAPANCRSRKKPRSISGSATRTRRSGTPRASPARARRRPGCAPSRSRSAAPRSART